MNKVLALAALPVLLAACQFSKKEELRKELVRRCSEGATTSGLTGEMRTIYDKFCDCNAEQITANMSSADIRAVEKLRAEGKQAEADAKLMPVILSCIEDWQRESEAAANSQPQDSVKQ